MREILFRGKRYSQSEKDGDWIVGYYTGLDNGVHYIKSNTAEYYAVHGETLGQYTGLDDINGRKIFEGDILDGSWITPNDPMRFSVKWYDIHAGFNLMGLNTEAFQIIGNIHDNPDLLEESK